MFHDIPEAVLARMRSLEAMDARDRADGTPRMQRLRQIPQETGKLLAILARSAPEGEAVEVGTSAGYSALWILRGAARLTTFEVLPEKVALAEETFRLAEVGDRVRLVHGDAREGLRHGGAIGFCFLDAEKGVYREVYDLVIPKLAPGGIVAADNVISHQQDLAPFVEHALADPRVDALVVPIGKGVLVCRRVDG